MHLLFCVAGAQTFTSSQSNPKSLLNPRIKQEPVDKASSIKKESKPPIDRNNNRIKYRHGIIKLERKDDVKIEPVTGSFPHSEQPDIKPEIITIESPSSHSTCSEEVSEWSDDQLPVTRLNLNLETCEGVRVIYESQHSLLLSKMHYLKDLINFRGDHKTQCTGKQAELIQIIICQFSGISSVPSSKPLHALLKAQGIVDIDTITSAKQTTDNQSADNPLSDNLTTENLATGNHASDNLATNNVATDNVTTENQTTNNKSTDSLAKENVATDSLALSKIVSMNTKQDNAGSEGGQSELTMRSKLEVKGKGHRKRKVNFGDQTHEKARKLQLPGIGAYTGGSDTETTSSDSELSDRTKTEQPVSIVNDTEIVPKYGYKLEQSGEVRSAETSYGEKHESDGKGTPNDTHNDAQRGHDLHPDVEQSWPKSQVEFQK